MLTQSYKTIPNLSSNKNRANDFLTKIINFKDAKSIKGLINYPNLEIETYKEIVQNWLICNKETLIDKCNLVLQELKKDRRLEYSDNLRELFNEIRLILEQLNSIIFSKNVNLFV